MLDEQHEYTNARRAGEKTRYPRTLCVHCGRDVAYHPTTGKVSGHLLITDYCLQKCCGSPHGSEWCRGSETIGGARLGHIENLRGAL